MQHRPELDGVRGVACLLVLSLHCCIGLIETEPGSVWQTVQIRAQPFLFGGVDLFFILSGFLIGGTLMDRCDQPHYFRTFWTRRFARIMPVYFLVIGVTALFFLAQRVYPTPLGNELTYSALPFWPYLLFVQNIYMAFAGNGGVISLGVTWSLAIEEQFYLVVPFLFFFLPRRVVVALALLVIIATPFVRGVMMSFSDWHAAYLMTFDRFDALALGIVLAATVRRQGLLAKARRAQLAINLVAAVLLVLQALDLWDVAGTRAAKASGGMPHVWQVFCAAQYVFLDIAMAGLFLNLFTSGDGWIHAVLRNPILTRVGLVSYAAYMYHQTINWSAYYLLYHSNAELTHWSQAYMPALVLGITFALAAVSYRWFEMPIRRWAHAVSKGYGRAPALAEGAVG